MSADRLRALGVRWGLVSLGVISLVAARFLRRFLITWVEFRVHAAPSLLMNRMSQLKPAMFKAPYLEVYAAALLALLVLTLATLFVVGLREAVRGVPDERAEDT